MMHMANDCPNRQFCCKYCSHEDIYIRVIEHWSVCKKYPVECPNKHLGCQWGGERADLKRHLKEYSVEGECQFVRVACPYSKKNLIRFRTCNELLLRHQVEEHKANACPDRPFTCQFCDHQATYIKVISQHWPACKKYPLECPNQSGENGIEQQNIPQHLNVSCPLQVIKCEFSYAGCEVECRRQHMQTHLDENMKVHLTAVFQYVQHKTISNDEYYRRQMDTVTLVLNLVKHKPSAPVFVPPPDMVLASFEKHKRQGDHCYGSPFYSHIGRYKMCLRVDANGLGSGKDTHISVYVCLMQGEQDDRLKWPFRGDIMIQLLNQKKDEGHCENTLHFDDKADDEVAGRVMGREHATGWGTSNFKAQNELNTEDKEYLKNDCLKFRVSKIIVKSM